MKNCNIRWFNYFKKVFFCKNSLFGGWIDTIMITNIVMRVITVLLTFLYLWEWSLFFSFSSSYESDHCSSHFPLLLLSRNRLLPGCFKHEIIVKQNPLFSMVAERIIILFPSSVWFLTIQIPQYLNSCCFRTLNYNSIAAQGHHKISTVIQERNSAF